jgi:signal transduction histidine kinase
MKRVVLIAAAAIAVLFCAAALVWSTLVHATASTVAEQARLAGELLDAKAPISDALASTLVRPGLHIFLLDRDTGLLIDGSGGGITDHRIPLGAGFPTDAAPRGGPPPGLQPPDDRPPTVGGPLEPRPPPRERPMQRSGFAQFAQSLAHIPAIRVARNTQAIEIAPDARALGMWLALTIGGLGIGCIGVGAIAAGRIILDARSERRALEASIAEKREAAERYQRFLADTGHELRTPLTVMTGYVDILRARNADEPLDDRILDGMHAETARMRILVEKMLTLARLESTVSVPRLLDITQAAADAAATLRRRYPQRAVEVHTSGHASIVIDADDYAAAIGNLLENAVKYAPDSPITIETSVTGRTATTTVIDVGPGIPASDRNAIFERFQRGSGRNFREGLGLGLAIVKRIADRWNGSIDLETTTGRTVFRLSFPLADEESYAPAR